MRFIARLCFWSLGAALAVVVLPPLFVYLLTYSSIYTSADMVPHKEVALVLGASIKSNGELSAVLKERADAALLLYTTGRVSRILVSGDNATSEYDEVYPVGRYLKLQGVPQQDIFLDYAGFDTFSSIYRAKYVFGVSSAVVVSQRFHLPRALFIARELGLSAIGYNAGAPSERYVPNTLREVPAIDKAVIDLFMSRKSKYIGPAYPVTGDSAPTWVGPSSEML